MFFSPNHLKAGCYLTISSEPRPSIVVFKRTTSISEEIWFKVVFSETMIFLKIKYKFCMEFMFFTGFSLEGSFHSQKKNLQIEQ